MPFVSLHYPSYRRVMFLVVSVCHSIWRGGLTIHENYRIGGCRLVHLGWGTPGLPRPTPMTPKFHNFMQFLEILAISYVSALPPPPTHTYRGLAPPPTGNPRSALNSGFPGVVAKGKFF